jgi:hypothetical protein
MPFTEDELDRYIGYLEHVWQDLSQAAGINQEVQNKFDIGEAEAIEERMAEEGRQVTLAEGFYLDMNLFMFYETGRSDWPYLMEWVAPLGATVDIAERTLRSIFLQAVPRMRALQKALEPPDYA